MNESNLLILLLEIYYWPVQHSTGQGLKILIWLIFGSGWRGGSSGISSITDSAAVWTSSRLFYRKCTNWWAGIEYNFFMILSSTQSGLCSAMTRHPLKTPTHHIDFFRGSISWFSKQPRMPGDNYCTSLVVVVTWTHPYDASSTSATTVNYARCTLCTSPYVIASQLPRLINRLLSWPIVIVANLKISVLTSHTSASEVTSFYHV